MMKKNALLVNMNTSVHQRPHENVGEEVFKDEGRHQLLFAQKMHRVAPGLLRYWKKKVARLGYCEPGNEMYGHYFLLRMSVCTYVHVSVRRKKWMISARRGISGVVSHGKHTRATEHAIKLGNNFPLLKNGPQNCPASLKHHFKRAEHCWL